MDKSLSDYGCLTLGSLFRKLSDELTREVDKFYRLQGIEIGARQLPCLMLIRDNGHISVTQLAQKLGQTHPAVVQLSRKLIAKGWVFDVPDPKDDRKRLMSLTPQGYTFLDQIEPLLGVIEASLTEHLGRDGLVHQTLCGLEQALTQRPFSQTLTDHLTRKQSGELSIHEFEAADSEDFRDLNYQWLSEYFYIEEHDKTVLSNPLQYIIEPGGRIFMGKIDGKNVATCALIKAGENALELSKMAVERRYRHCGLGRQLLNYVLHQYQQMPESQLFLESNSQLKPAIKLYESLGFSHQPHPSGDSKYARADVYMVYQQS
ncbi:MAG: bifunctional helix-turn-helix transcriptional regulator/GNAT family N-acetyltransferase [Gammaproteobacteria bacterium]|nr:bifunctional helix-turn-helix transcriptional regulator/GNAT family N-acetyltransferase [Gammaproteobacteria bacterium]